MCPILFRQYPQSPVRLKFYTDDVRSILPLPCDFKFSSCKLANVLPSQYKKVIPVFKSDRTLLATLFPNFTYIVYFHTDKILVSCESDTELFPFSLSRRDDYVSVGFERTEVYYTGMFLEYRRILYDNESSQYFYKDTWHPSPSPSPSPTNSKSDYMSLMDTKFDGVLKLADGSLKYLE